MIQHRGAERARRYGLLARTSLLSLAYLLSVVHFLFLNLKEVGHYYLLYKNYIKYNF